MVELRQVDERIESIPVYRDGDRLWEEDFPVIVYSDGETAMTVETTEKWEARHRHYLELAEKGELPEYTALEEGGDPANVSAVRSLVVYREGDRVWCDDFDIIVTPDGEERIPGRVTRELERRREEYRELSRLGLLPEPDATPAPASHDAAGG